MGRTRQFDIDQALDRATIEFWAKGYAGTTLDDLTEAMGINRPSLYRVFGNKEALFARVLVRIPILTLALSGSYPPYAGGLVIGTQEMPCRWRLQGFYTSDRKRVVRGQRV